MTLYYLFQHLSSNHPAADCMCETEAGLDSNTMPAAMGRLCVGLENRRTKAVPQRLFL